RRGHGKGVVWYEIVDHQILGPFVGQIDGLALLDLRQSRRAELRDDVIVAVEDARLGFRHATLQRRQETFLMAVVVVEEYDEPASGQLDADVPASGGAGGAA